MGGKHLSLEWRLMRQSEAWKHVRRSAQTCPCTRKRAKLGAARMAMGADVCSLHAQTQGARRKRVHVHASLWSRDAAHVANNNCTATNVAHQIAHCCGNHALCGPPDIAALDGRPAAVQKMAVRCEVGSTQSGGGVGLASMRGWRRRQAAACRGTAIGACSPMCCV